MFHKSVLRSLPLLLMALSLLISPTALLADDTKQEMTVAVDSVRPALIRIHIVSTDYRQGREVKMESAGSGVIISADGYAITNHHVASDAERIVCTLADRREVDAHLVGTDPLSDIAVIRLISPDSKPFPTAAFGDSSKLQVGDRVFAMGCPLALSQSVTMGIVSNTELIMPKNFGPSGFTLEGEDVGSIVRWIGHDALIEPGNSGGPLVNRNGEIIGINEISIGLAGAIPSNIAKKIGESLIKDGKVTRSWLGLEVQPLLESSKLEKGILVSGVMSDSPAMKAGFKSGDILLSLDGKEVKAIYQEEIPLFNQFVADIPVGKQVEAKITRDGADMSLTITTTDRQKAMEKQHELKNWGICASNISYLTQKEMELKSQDGVIVTGVLPSGPAGSAKPQISEGDVIVKVGKDAIKDVAQLRAVTKQLTDASEDPVSVIVNFDRDKQHFATVVKVGKKDFTEPGAEISKAWLGIDMQALTRELAEALDIPTKTGVRITQVYPASNAEKAGLQVGDLLVKLDGEDIPAEQVGDEEVLPSIIRQYDIGAEVKFQVIRDGKTIDVPVKLEASPKLARDYPKYEDESFEFVARDIAFSDKSNGNIKAEQTGVYIESVAEGSWAALAYLQNGDVITDIDGKKVDNLDSLKQLMADITEKKPNAIVFKITRGIHTVYLEAKPGWPKSE